MFYALFQAEWMVLKEKPLHRYEQSGVDTIWTSDNAVDTQHK